MRAAWPSTLTAPTTPTAPRTAASSSTTTSSLLINAWWDRLDFLLPTTRTNQTWEIEIDTYDPCGTATLSNLAAGQHITVQPRSIIVLHGHRA